MTTDVHCLYALINILVRDTLWFCNHTCTVTNQKTGEAPPFPSMLMPHVMALRTKISFIVQNFGGKSVRTFDKRKNS